MNFEEYFKREKEFTVSAPGRVEIGGNHTDHQGGCVLAGAVNLLCSADVAGRDDLTVRIYSEGFGEFQIDLRELDPVKSEEGTTAALVRGIAKKFAEIIRDENMASGAGKGRLIGFDAFVKSDVLVGSGLSSSAAFEVMLARIFKRLGGFNASYIDIAKIARFAENEYYGKPCGLMDQMASSAGGLAFMDFKDKDNPLVEKADFDLKSYGYSLCIVDTKADHTALTDEYAAIPKEMKEVAAYFGKELLSELSEEEFYSRLGELREKLSHRALLRSIHYFEETKRARSEFDAIKNGDINTLLELVRESGRSSFEYLQNVTPCGSTKHQDMAFTLKLCEKALEGRGAVRVHGGGFAGTVLAFVPDENLKTFKQKIASVLGADAIHTLSFL